MRPPKKKRPLRKPDGRPEMRSPDQMLKDASESISNDLPTKNRKLDLDSYFRSGEADRVANRLLKDNGVLPQHLQDRKDAETLRTQAEETLSVAIDALGRLHAEAMNDVASLASYFTSEEARSWLPDIPTQALGDEISHGEARTTINGLLETTRILGLKRQEALRTYEEHLLESNAATDRYNLHVATTGRLMPVYPTEVPADIESRLQAAESRLPPAIDWQEQDAEKLLDLIRAATSPINKLKRLLARGTRARSQSSNLLVSL